MRIPSDISPRGFRRTDSSASVLIIVLWITVGLLAITLYFADSMGLELKATGNRVAGMASGQAVEGASRYVNWALSAYFTNGMLVTNSQFVCTGVPIGEARFWLLGRNPDIPMPSEPFFGLVDEAAKLNLNRANSNALATLPGMNSELAAAIVDWRSTNATLSLSYESQGYSAKHAPFESVDELRLVYGMSLEDLLGQDANLNGVLDTDEGRYSSSAELLPGLLETTTVFTREPNFHADGTVLTNINTRAQIQTLLTDTFGSSRSGQIMNQLGFTQNNTPNFRSLLGFYLASGLTPDDFERISPNLCTTTNSYTYGRVNINTASREVLTALFVGAGVSYMVAESAASSLVSYRQQNPQQLTSVAWMVTALGRSNQVVTSLAGRDLITTRSFQYSADIVAVGPFGRGYQRVKYVFDLSDGAPKIIYRQDLSRLGWALGERTRSLIIAGNLP